MVHFLSAKTFWFSFQCLVKLSPTTAVPWRWNKALARPGLKMDTQIRLRTLEQLRCILPLRTFQHLPLINWSIFHHLLALLEEIWDFLRVFLFLEYFSRFMIGYKPIFKKDETIPSTKNLLSLLRWPLLINIHEIINFSI